MWTLSYSILVIGNFTGVENVQEITSETSAEENLTTEPSSGTLTGVYIGVALGVAVMLALAVFMFLVVYFKLCQRRVSHTERYARMCEVIIIIVVGMDLVFDNCPGRY